MTLTIQGQRSNTFFGKREDRIRFAALINNKPSKVKVDYHGYEINKEEVPAWIVFPWEDWDK